MLQHIRDRLTGPFVWFIVGLIVIPFAFFGIETFRTGGGDPTVAKVGDQKITQSQFKAAYDQRMQQLQAMMGENFRSDLIDRGRFRQTVLDDMIQESLLRQQVRKAGYRAADAMVFQSISAIPAFQENGKFSGDAYRARLASQGYTPARFEGQLRDSLVIDQMRDGILHSGFVAPAAAAQAFRLDQQQRTLAYATFAAARYLAQVEVGAAAIQKRYEDKKASYQSPERMKVAYLELALEALPPAAAPTADYLKAIYSEQKKTRFSTVEERKTRHILVNFGADKEASKKHAQQLVEQLGKGADFAALARASSDDPGSKNSGGELGWVRAGQMVEKFEKAMFGLKKGEVSEPVETEFGWHVIQVEDIKEARTKAFEDPDVQADLLAAYRRQDAEHRFKELSDKLEQTAFESPNSLDAAAKATGLAVQTSDWFTRDAGNGIGAQAPVRQAAFAGEVRQNGENSRPLPIGQNRVVVVRKAEYEAPRPRTLEEVSAQIRDELKLEGARARAEADAKAVQDAVAAGRPLEAAAREKKAEFKNAGAVRRNAQGIDPKVLETLFQLQPPTAGQVRATQVRLTSGDVAVLVLSSVQDAEWTAAPEADRKTEGSRLRDAAAGAEFSAYREDLKKRMKVKIVNPPAAEPDPAS